MSQRQKSETWTVTTKHLIKHMQQARTSWLKKWFVALKDVLRRLRGGTIFVSIGRNSTTMSLPSSDGYIGMRPSILFFVLGILVSFFVHLTSPDFLYTRPANLVVRQDRANTECFSFMRIRRRVVTFKAPIARLWTFVLCCMLWFRWVTLYFNVCFASLCVFLHETIRCCWFSFSLSCKPDLSHSVPYTHPFKWPDY